MSKFCSEKPSTTHAKLPENSAALTVNDVIFNVASSAATLMLAPHASAAATQTVLSVVPANPKVEPDVMLSLQFEVLSNDRRDMRETSISECGMPTANAIGFSVFEKFYLAERRCEIVPRGAKGVKLGRPPIRVAE